MEGKKLKRGKEGKFQKSEKEKKRENIEALYERLKRNNSLVKSKFGHRCPLIRYTGNLSNLVSLSS